MKLMQKEIKQASHDALEELVRTPGKAFQWARERGIRINYDPPQIIPYEEIPMAINESKFEVAKQHPGNHIQAVDTE